MRTKPSVEVITRSPGGMQTKTCCVCRRRCGFILYKLAALLLFTTHYVGTTTCILLYYRLMIYISKANPVACTVGGTVLQCLFNIYSLVRLFSIYGCVYNGTETVDRPLSSGHSIQALALYLPWEFSPRLIYTEVPNIELLTVSKQLDIAYFYSYVSTRWRILLLSVLSCHPRSILIMSVGCTI